MAAGVIRCGLSPPASVAMKIISYLIALFACQSAFGAELEIRQPVNAVMVQYRAGLYDSAPLKNPKSFFYLKDGSFEVGPNVLEALVAKAKGGFMKMKAQPPPTKLRVVMVNADKNGMVFSFRDDGKISYRGVREIGKGTYEEDDSVFPRGTFEDRELTGRMMVAWKASL